MGVFSFSGTNVCAKENGGCKQLCLYRGNSRRTCACAHGYLAGDGVTCLRHEGYLLYSGRTILKSIHLSDETNLNSPVRPYENPHYFKNIIALAFDYNQRKEGTNRIFYSDAHFGNIQLIKDNWEDRKVIVESKYKLYIVCVSLHLAGGGGAKQWYVHGAVALPTDHAQE